VVDYCDLGNERLGFIKAGNSSLAEGTLTS
jgi:hypothetical protein